LNDIKKENDKRKKDEFLSKARMFEQKKGPTDEEKKLIIQKAAAKRKFERQLQKNLKSNENMNPMALEIQLKRDQENGAGETISTNQQNQTQQSDWELVQQIGAPSYYWNRVTNETTYELPVTEQPMVAKEDQMLASKEEMMNSSVEDVTPSSSSSAADDEGWLSCQNEKGKTYYWNYHTTETVFTLPAHLDPNTIPSYVPEAPEEVSPERELSQQERAQAEADLKNWTTEWDDHYQAHYYRNHITETLQWDPPLCFATSPPQIAEVPVVVEPTLSTEAKEFVETPASESLQADEPQPTDAHEVPVSPVNEPTEISESTQVSGATEVNEPTVAPPPATKPPASDSPPNETNESPPTATHEPQPTEGQGISLDHKEPPVDQPEPSPEVVPIIRSSVSPPPPPPPPPRKPKVTSSLASNPEPQVHSPSADTITAEPTRDQITHTVDTPSEQTNSAPKETPAIVTVPTISPLVEQLDLQGTVPELELKEECHDDGDGDDDVLVGDGSKPVGCTSCSIS
jgi:hypothetical protein